MKRTEVWTKTAHLISCKCCGTKLTEAVKERNNSRTFYKLDKNEYLCKKTKCLDAAFQDKYESVEHDGINETKDGLFKSDIYFEKLKREHGVK